MPISLSFTPELDPVPDVVDFEDEPAKAILREWAIKFAVQCLIHERRSTKKPNWTLRIRCITDTATGLYPIDRPDVELRSERLIPIF